MKSTPLASLNEAALSDDTLHVQSPGWLEQRACEELDLAGATDDLAAKAAHLNRTAHFATARELAAKRQPFTARP